MCLSSTAEWKTKRLLLRFCASFFFYYSTKGGRWITYVPSIRWELTDSIPTSSSSILQGYLSISSHHQAMGLEEGTTTTAVSLTSSSSSVIITDQSGGSATAAAPVVDKLPSSSPSAAAAIIDDGGRISSVDDDDVKGPSMMTVIPLNSTTSKSSSILVSSKSKKETMEEKINRMLIGCGIHDPGMYVCLRMFMYRCMYMLMMMIYTCICSMCMYG